MPTHGVKIDDSTFAIATGFNGVYIISENGDIKDVSIDAEAFKNEVKVPTAEQGESLKLKDGVIKV